MGGAIVYPAGGYRYLKGMFQYSAGVAAEPGFEIERARFLRPVSLEEGFQAIAAHLAASGGRWRPSAPANCARRRPSPRRGSGRSTVCTSARWSDGESSATRRIRSLARTSARRSTRR